MLRGPLGQEKYKPKFSGHDTFPFRYAWLTKIVHYLERGNVKKIKEFEKNKLIKFSSLSNKKSYIFQHKNILNKKKKIACTYKEAVKLTNFFSNIQK